MKAQVLAAFVAVALVSGANAQNQPNNPPPGGNPPPMGGQPRGMSPGERPPGNPPGNPPGMNMPNMGGQPGQPPGMPHGDKAFAPEMCSKQIPRLRRLADNCLKVKKEDKRRNCFDQLPSKLPPGFMEGCRAQIEPMKAEYEAKEREKYPNQKSAMEGHEKGPHEGGPGDHGQKMADCPKLADKVRKEGEACLKQKDQAKRKSCFDKIGDHVRQSNAEEMCGEMINAIKSEFQSREATMFPKDPPSIQ